MLLTRKFHLLRAANFPFENRFLAYGTAIAIFIIATILRIVLDPFVLPPAPFFTYYTAVLLTAFFCGVWPAVFAVAISGIAAWYFFLPPRGSFEIRSLASLALLSFFQIVVLIISVVASFLCHLSPLLC